MYEHSHYDLRQQVEYVLEVTKQKSLFYVGHSQGTTVMFQRLAEADEQWQKKIRTFFALAPAGGFFKPFYPFRFLENNVIQALIQIVLEGDLGVYPIAVPALITNTLAEICSLKPIQYFCAYLIGVSSGSEILAQMNNSRIPVYLKHFPAATSTLNLLSWAQVFKYHELRRLDLGRTKNLEVYGRPEPPSFRYQNILADTYVFFRSMNRKLRTYHNKANSSKDDVIADEEDVKNVILKNYGPGMKESFDLDHFTHFDFAIGLRATDEVYKPIIRIIYDKIEAEGCSL